MTPRATGNLGPDPGTERRVFGAAARAREVLGHAPGDVPLPDEDALGVLIEAMVSKLTTELPSSDWQSRYESGAAQLEQVRARYGTRMTALEGVRKALGHLSETTAPDEMLAGAPEALCGSHELDRVILSLVRDGRMVPQAAFFRDDGDGAEVALAALRADPPRLEHPLIETEALRRRRATLVTDAQLHPRVHRGMAEVMGWESFVAVPVVLREVIAVIHADRPDGRPLDVLDGDVMWEFAAGLAEAYESAVLRRSLRRQRTEMRGFVEWLAARSGELEDVSMELLPEQRLAPEPPGQLGVVASAPKVDDRAVFEDLLTRRELEVLRLLARGESNRSIAAQLVISPGTVKFHVSNILEKLRVANRAEAVTRYHRLVQMGPRADGGMEWR